MSTAPRGHILWDRTNDEDEFIDAYHSLDGAEYFAEYRDKSIEVKPSLTLSGANDGSFHGIRKFGPAVVQEQQSDLGSFIREPRRADQSTNPSKLIVTETEKLLVPDIYYRLNKDSKDFDSMAPELQTWTQEFTEDNKEKNKGYFLQYVVQEGNAETGLPSKERWCFSAATQKDLDQGTVIFPQTTLGVPYTIDGKEQGRLTIEEYKRLKKTYENIAELDIRTIGPYDKVNPK